MPTISIFIRKDDLPKWQALENKSEWLHSKLNSTHKVGDRLNSSPPMMITKIEDVPPSPEKTTNPIIKTKEDVVARLEAKCPRHHVPLSSCKDKH